MDYYRGKNILVTGAFGGFGLSFISHLLNEGANLILSDTDQAASPYLTDPQDIPGVTSLTKRQIISVIPADLSTAEGCSALHDGCRTLGKPLDMIIHNAGIAFGGEYLDVPLDLNEKVVAINLLSIMRLNALFLPELVSRGSGHLMYISSVAGFVATPYAVSYTTSKFAVRAFAMALHGEYRDRGIRTTIVYPFFSKTPILKSTVFGNPKARYLPGFVATTADQVVSCALGGAAKGRLHVCPGFFSKFMWVAVRLRPVISPQRKIWGHSA
jgi:short-subunit dehydrogenase